MKGQAERQELAEVLSRPEGDARHQLLEAFVRSHPSYGHGHLYLGLSYMLNRFSGALELPASVIVLGGRGIPVHAPPETVAERLEQAADEFNRAMELDPELRESATTNLAAVELMARRFDSAIVYIEQLLADGVGPYEPLLRQHLAIAYREMGQYDAALRVLESLVDSELTHVHRQLALTHLCRDEPKQAEEALAEQLRREDSELDRLLARAVAAELRGDATEARSTYSDIAFRCRFDPQNELLGVNAARRGSKVAD